MISPSQRAAAEVHGRGKGGGAASRKAGFCGPRALARAFMSRNRGNAFTHGVYGSVNVLRMRVNKISDRCFPGFRSRVE